MQRSSIHAPSSWADPAESAVAEIVSCYGRGERRDGLQAVGALRRRLAPQGVGSCIVVVGTNGKTSTATYVSRVLNAAGIHTGLYTSPHVARWTERVLIDGRPCDEDEFLSALRHCHAAAQRQGDQLLRSLRFFDVLTLAAELIFERHAVEVGVFEAGIGGRLDATRAMHPGVVALSSVGYDHQELLGDTLEQILVEKLGVAGGGADLITARLPDRLRQIQRRWATRHDVALTEVDTTAAEQLGVDDGAPQVQRQNLAVALATTARAVARFGLPVEAGELPGHAAAIDMRVRGRFETGLIADVPYVLDTAHNVSAWSELTDALGQTGKRFVAVVALTVERNPSDLAAILRRSDAIAGVIVTGTRVRPCHSPVELQRVLGESAITASIADTPERGFAAVVEQARGGGRAVLVTGSTYLVSDFLAWCENDFSATGANGFAATGAAGPSEGPSGRLARAHMAEPSSNVACDAA